MLYADNELRVELPGWSFEEVHSVVRSIQAGDWAYFHEVMSWGSSRINWQVGSASSADRGLDAGEIAGRSRRRGSSSVQEVAEVQPVALQEVDDDPGFPSDDEGDLIPWFVENPPPVVIAAFQQLGWRNWMIGLGVLLLVGSFVLLRLLLGLVLYGFFNWGLGEWAVDPVVGEGSLGLHFPPSNVELLDHPERLIMLAWIASVLHRLRILLLGLRTNPVRVGVVYARGIREIRLLEGVGCLCGFG